MITGSGFLTNLVRVQGATLVLVFVCACTYTAKEVETFVSEKTAVFVDAQLQLDHDAEHFAYGVLVVGLYEYDPWLADVRALLVDSKRIEVSYTSKETPFLISMALASESKKEGRNRYYLVAEILNRNGVRTHYGYETGSGGVAKVFAGSSDVRMVLRAIANHSP